MTPADVLAEHHRALDEQLERLIADAQRLDGPELRACWSRFETELLRHLDYEEAAILPAFARRHAGKAQAANLLRGFVIGSLVVQEGDKPVGIVTTTDLLDLIGRGAERPVPKSTRWTLRARGPRHARPIERTVRG